VWIRKARVGFLYSRTEFLKNAHSFGTQCLDLWMQRLHVTKARTPSNPQASDTSLESDAKVRRRRVLCVHVPVIGLCNHTHHQGSIVYRPGL
jgi:hypothetical protein